MISIQSILRKDDISPLLDKLRKSDPVVRKVAAKAAARQTRENFKELAGARHRRTGGALNFYADAAKKTTGVVINDDIVVVVDKEGVRQRYLGGTIKATRRKYLAIPSDEAGGKVPKDFGDELFFFRKGSVAGLALPDGKGMRVMFWLKKSVKQDPDSTVMPTDSEYVAAIEPEVDAQIERIANG